MNEIYLKLIIINIYKVLIINYIFIVFKLLY